jgi:hypothetical protein
MIGAFINFLQLQTTQENCMFKCIMELAKNSTLGEKSGHFAQKMV